MTHENAITTARDNKISHSLISSRRFWQKVASANGVAAWGYAYENGEFNRPNFTDISVIHEYGLSQKLSNSIRVF